MKVLVYNELNPKTILGFSKLQQYLENDDFKSAEVKKSAITFTGPGSTRVIACCFRFIGTWNKAMR